MPSECIYHSAQMLPVFEGTQGVRVVYTDVDGTMLGYGGSFLHDPDGKPTSEPAQALASALAHELEIVPVSGRAMPGIARDARMLGMSVAIGEMGAIVSYDMGRRTTTHLGDYPFGDEPPTHAIERLGVDALLRETFTLEPHAPWATGRAYTCLLRGLADPKDVEQTLLDAGFGWLRLVDNGRLHGAYLGLAAGAGRVYHLMPAGVSKAAAIAADRKERNIARDECIAIGDSLADLAMSESVGAVVITSDALAADTDLANAASITANARSTKRPGNLGWADAINALASSRE